MAFRTPNRVILNIDPNPSTRISVTAQLCAAGLQVIEGGSAQEAISLARTAKPQLVLLKPTLPDMDGLELCSRLKRDPAFASVLIVLHTEDAVESEKRTLGLETGADAYLSGLMAGETLVANVKALLRICEAEQSLRKSEEEFRAMFELAAVGIVQADIPTGHFLRVNRKFCEMTGYSESELLNKKFEDVTRAQDRDNDRDVLRTLASGTISEYTVEKVYIRKNGSLLWAILNATVIYDAEGKPASTIGVVQDITDRKMAEQERELLLNREKSAYVALSEANRLKDEFLAIVSHELRTPLNAILGWAHLLNQGRLKDAAARHALEIIERNARSQARLIDDLLDVSRIISGNLRLELRPTDVNQLVRGTLEVLRPTAAAKQVTIATSLPEPGTPVSGDPARLQQVIWNLVSNAIKFNPPGGQIQIRVEQVGSTVRISVRDTGAGINREFLPHIFERFSQADTSSRRMQGGLGLGLAIVRHITELHGGTVAADSPGEGKGSTFWVTLPVTNEIPDRNPQTGNATPGSPAEELTTKRP